MTGGQRLWGLVVPILVVIVGGSVVGVHLGWPWLMPALLVATVWVVGSWSMRVEASAPLEHPVLAPQPSSRPVQSLVEGPSAWRAAPPALPGQPSFVLYPPEAWVWLPLVVAFLCLVGTAALLATGHWGFAIPTGLFAAWMLQVAWTQRRTVLAGAPGWLLVRDHGVRLVTQQSNARVGVWSTRQTPVSGVRVVSDAGPVRFPRPYCTGPRGAAVATTLLASGFAMTADGGALLQAIADGRDVFPPSR